MKLLLSLTVLSFVCLNAICQQAEGNNVNHPNVHKIVVKEVVQTTSYTYIHGAETNRVLWIAVPKMEAEKGETYYYQGGMEMRDFKSKELDRTFSSILFLNGLVHPDLVEDVVPEQNGQAKKTEIADKPGKFVPGPVQGGITIGELFSNKNLYANKTVKIRGEVSKYNASIMGKNWIHLRDGSDELSDHDFTATSIEEVKVGDIITIEGVITLGKDFGAGYFYDLIMEDAKIIDH